MLGDCEQYVTAVDEGDFYHVSIYPNPNQGVSQLGWQSSSPSTVSIYNTDGKLIKAQDIETQQTIEVNVKHVPNGIYTLMIRSNHNKSLLYSQRLIILP